MVRGKYDYAGLSFPIHEGLDTSLKLIPDMKSPGHIMKSQTLNPEDTRQF